MMSDHDYDLRLSNLRDGLYEHHSVESKVLLNKMREMESEGKDAEAIVEGLLDFLGLRIAEEIRLGGTEYYETLGEVFPKLLDGADVSEFS